MKKSAAISKAKSEKAEQGEGSQSQRKPNKTTTTKAGKDPATDTKTGVDLVSKMVLAKGALTKSRMPQPPPKRILVTKMGSVQPNKMAKAPIPMPNLIKKTKKTVAETPAVKTGTGMDCSTLPRYMWPTKSSLLKAAFKGNPVAVTAVATVPAAKAKGPGERKGKIIGPAFKDSRLKSILKPMKEKENNVIVEVSKPEPLPTLAMGDENIQTEDLPLQAEAEASGMTVPLEALAPPVVVGTMDDVEDDNKENVASPSPLATNDADAEKKLLTQYRQPVSIITTDPTKPVAADDCEDNTLTDIPDSVLDGSLYFTPNVHNQQNAARTPWTGLCTKFKNLDLQNSPRE